jgi:membrane associated rhomboid family serine protease
MRERRRERKLAQEKSEQDPGFSGPDQGEIVLSKEETELMQIVLERRKRILVPALWTLAFVSLIYTGCALAADRSSRKAASESTSDSGSSDSGIFAGANKGFLGTFQWAKDRFGPEIFFPCMYVLVHLSRRSFPRLWESLAFIPGERYRTLFTYAFAHSSGAALFLNGLFVIGFMPPVIRYFDGDRFHTVAFFLSVPIIAGFVLHFPYRIGAQAMGISMELGASGAVYGLLGVLCAAHWNESTYRDWSISQGRCMFVYLALVELFAWRNGSVLVSHLVSACSIFRGHQGHRRAVLT